MLQRRGIIQDKGPTRVATPTKFKQKMAVPHAAIKTAHMLLKELEYDMDIEDILATGPLHHNNLTIKNCRRCIQCRFGIKWPTASKWRKRLGLPRWEGEVA